MMAKDRIGRHIVMSRDRLRRLELPMPRLRRPELERPELGRPRLSKTEGTPAMAVPRSIGRAVRKRSGSFTEL